jgi:hypothetical protein
VGKGVTECSSQAEARQGGLLQQSTLLGRKVLARLALSHSRQAGEQAAVNMRADK